MLALSSLLLPALISSLGLSVRGAPAPDDELEIRVVDEQGAPVAGAEVFARSLDEIEERGTVVLTAMEMMDQVLADEAPWRSDALGRVRMPRHRSRSFLVLGRKNERLGTVRPDPDRPWSILELQPARTWRARVVDVAGEPVAGVPVALFQSSILPLEVATSDGEGRVRLGRSLAFVPPDRRPFLELSLGLHIPWAEAPRAPLPKHPEETVSLLLPPTGRVSVEVEGLPESAVAQTVGQLTVPIAEPADPSRRRPRRLEPTDGVTHRLRDGRIEFPYVALGGRWTATVGVFGQELRWSQPLPAPTRPGEHVRVTVPATGVRELQGRLLDLDARPVAGRMLRFELRLDETPSRPRSRGWFRTDDTGAYRLGVLWPDERPCWLHLLAEDESLFAIHRIVPSEASPIEVPELRQGDGPLTLEGQVVDDTGAPRPGARVWRMEILSGLSHPSWSRDGSVLADERGRFRVPAPVARSSRQWGLTAESAGWYTDEVHRAPSGDAKIRIGMRRAGILRLPDPRLRMPDDSELELEWRCTPLARNPDIAPSTRPRTLTARESDGRVFDDQLTPGAYRATLRWKNVVVHELDSLVVSAGSVCADPRLEFSVQELFDIHTVELRGVGDPASRHEELFVSVRVHGGSFPCTRHPDPSPLRYWCPVRKGRDGVFSVRSREFRSLDRSLRGDATLTLRPMIRVRLELIGELGLGGDVAAEATLESGSVAGPGGLERSSPGPVFREPGEDGIVFRTEAPGTYTLRWKLSRVAGDEGRELPFRERSVMAGERSVEVADLDTLQTIQIPIDDGLRATLQAAAEELRGR